MSVKDMTTVSPRTILSELIAELLAELPGVRDGLPDAVHDARITTRRLREVVPLFASTLPEQVGAVQALLKRSGRRLGAVRELDAMHEHLGRIEVRFPETAVAAAVARRSVAAEQGPARRKMIKALERLSLPRRVVLSLPPGGALTLWRERLLPSGEWRTLLRERIGTQARSVASAVDHAGGVYFPNRSHSVRIAAKRLRYSVELADRTGLWRPPRLLRDLRRVQGTLGTLHDAQVLLERLNDLVPDGEVDDRDRRALTSAVRAEIADAQAAYRERRERLQAICAACARFASPPRSGIRGLLHRSTPAAARH
jgi:CHAD domain-containing protein